MARKPRTLSEKQKKFIEAYTQKLLSYTAAAREAGYADPSGEVAGLTSNPEVMNAIAGLMHEELRSWHQIALKAKKTLDSAMDPLIVAFDEKKGTYVFVGTKPGDQIAAAGKIIDYLSRNDKKSLQEKADEEDKRDKTVLVDEILGESEETSSSAVIPEVPELDETIN